MFTDFPIEMQVGETKDQTRSNIEKWLRVTNGWYTQLPDEYFDIVVENYVNELWRPKRKRL